MPYRIGISGSYGGMNLGDEAILESILRALRESTDAEIVVFSRRSEDTEKRHNVRALNVPELHKDDILKELEKLDLFVLGGGGLLFDGMVEVFLRDVNWAQELGIPVMTYAISAGPLKKTENKKLVVDTLSRVDKITVREAEAKRMLHDLGVESDIEITNDPALLLKPQNFTKEMLKKEGLDPDQPLVGFSVREPGPAAPDLNVDSYHAILADAADFMAQRFDAQIVFVPMERGEHRDLQHSHAVVAKMANAQRARVLIGEYSSGQVLGLMEHMHFVVGMRLHFLIFAAVQNVPFIPLPYASKVSGFIASLGMPMPSLSEINVGKLCAYIDRAWDMRKENKQQMAKHVPEQQTLARRTNDVLIELLKSKPPKNPGKNGK